MSETVVGFAGMTHLGINSAAATAAHGFSVLCYDADQAITDRLRDGRLPVVEPGLPELIEEHAARLAFTAEAADLRRCDVVYISADVPTDDEARSDLAPIHALIDRVAANLNPDAVLVILCQVPPGFTRGLHTVPAERRVYQVETLIFGRAVERAMRPERFIVGLADPAAPLPRRYREVLEAFACPILPMRYESAELAKISINFCLVASIGVANTLAEVSETIGADWSEIVPALKLDRRIGQYAYLAPGLGIAGGNLERDLRTVINLSGGMGVDTGIVEAWIANSAHRKDWCWRVLRERLFARDPTARVGVLGLAYKEDTHSTKNSPSLALLNHLSDKDVSVHDPVVPGTVVPFARACDEPMECADGADALVIATAWPQYRGLDLDRLARAMRGRLLLDPYRLLNGDAAAAAGFEYHTLGRPALHAD